MDQSGCTPSVSEATTHVLLHTECVADTFDQSVCCNNGFVVPLTKTVDKPVVSTGYKQRLQGIKGALTMTASPESIFERTAMVQKAFEVPA